MLVGLAMPGAAHAHCLVRAITAIADPVIDEGSRYGVAVLAHEHGSLHMALTFVDTCTTPQPKARSDTIAVTVYSQLIRSGNQERGFKQHIAFWRRTKWLHAAVPGSSLPSGQSQ